MALFSEIFLLNKMGPDFCRPDLELQILLLYLATSLSTPLSLNTRARARVPLRDLPFNDSNRSQLDAFFTNTGVVAGIHDLGHVFVTFRRFFHD
mgnify:CR=1 FL=1